MWSAIPLLSWLSTGINYKIGRERRHEPGAPWGMTVASKGMPRFINIRIQRTEYPRCVDDDELHRILGQFFSLHRWFIPPFPSGSNRLLSLANAVLGGFT